MIFVTNEIRAKVWGIDRKDKYTDIKLSTSEKGPKGYVYSHWFARAIGQAHELLKNCSEHETISITKSKLTNEGYKNNDGQGKSSVRWVIFEASLCESGKDSSKTPKTKKTKGSEKGFIDFNDKSKETKKTSKKNSETTEDADPWTAELPF